jgi:hypothetical protein
MTKDEATRYREMLGRLVTDAADRKSRVAADLLRQVLDAAEKKEELTIALGSGTGGYFSLSLKEQILYDVLSTSWVNTMNLAVPRISEGTLYFFASMVPCQIGTRLVSQSS